MATPVALSVSVQAGGCPFAHAVSLFLFCAELLAAGCNAGRLNQLLFFRSVNAGTEGWKDTRRGESRTRTEERRRENDGEAGCEAMRLEYENSGRLLGVLSSASFHRNENHPLYIFYPQRDSEHKETQTPKNLGMPVNNFVLKPKLK